MESQETRQFTVHPHILFSIIQAQAGTLSKALLEGVMNACDAQSTSLKITLTKEMFELVDDGRGINSKEEIVNWFGQFGTPHEEGDATYGSYRMGRGQLMSFAVNKWRTGTFEMNVDVQNKGLDYELKEGLRNHKGCTITGLLYKPLTDDEFTEVVAEFQDLVKFCEIPIRLNGKVISKKPSSLKWDAETDDAYIRVTDEKELKVYNIGVLVKGYPSWAYGCGGIVVSKKQLKVNFARNDILTNQCDTWRRISTYVKSTNLLKVAKKGSLNQSERSFLAKQLSYGYMRDTQVDKLNLKVITDATGRHHTIKDLLAATRLSVASDSQARTGAQLHRKGAAFVLSKETLERFCVSSLSEFIDVLTEVVGEKPRLDVMNFEDLAVNFSENYTTLTPNELPIAELLAFNVIDSYHDKFLKWYHTAERTSGKRELRVGDSNVANAWTDGSSYITLHRKLVTNAVTKGARGFMDLLLTLVHEYCHDSSDIESHEHDLVFFNKHHDLIQYGGAGHLLSLSLNMEKALNKAMTKAGCLPGKTVKTLAGVNPQQRVVPVSTQTCSEEQGVQIALAI